MDFAKLHSVSLSSIKYQARVPGSVSVLHTLYSSVSEWSNGTGTPLSPLPDQKQHKNLIILIWKI